MRIFVSYAHEQLSVAERLTYALRSDAHKVFLAEDELRGGDFEVMGWVAALDYSQAQSDSAG